MQSNKTEVAIGAVVLTVAIAFLAYLLGASGGILKADQYQLTASFRSAEGIVAGTDVRLSGVKIGTISDISLNNDTFRADTTLSIAKGTVLPDDSAAVIASEGLLGGNFVEIVPGGSLANFENGAEIEDTQGAVSLISLLLKFVTKED